MIVQKLFIVERVIILLPEQLDTKTVKILYIFVYFTLYL